MISINSQLKPNIQEIKSLVEYAFNEICPTDLEKFKEANNGQSVDEWFSMDAMIEYMKNGQLIEAREDEKLVGVVFVGMQNPISWPDGKKTELFVLAVHPQYRNQGIGKKLVLEAEDWARKMGSKKVLVNSHVFQEATHQWYLKQGYKQMGILKDYYDNGDAVFFCKELC